MHRKGRATLLAINSRGGGVTTMVGTNDTIGTMPIYMARFTGYGEEEISVYHRDITVEPISIVDTPNMNATISDDDYDTVFHTNDPVSLTFQFDDPTTREHAIRELSDIIDITGEDTLAERLLDI